MSTDYTKKTDAAGNLIDVLRNADGAVIPPDPGNADYKAFLIATTTGVVETTGGTPVIKTVDSQVFTP